MKNKVALIVAIIALLSIGAWTGYAQKEKPSNISYEYQILPNFTAAYGMDDGIKKLNELGAQGWELVGTSYNGNGSNPPTTLYFKRTKR